MIYTLLCIAAGGAVGAVARYLVSGVWLGGDGPGIPWGTFVVNVAGSLVIGVLAGLLEHWPIAPNVRAMILTGFLGAFTTFSTFSLEAVDLLRERQVFLAGAYVLGSCAAGLMAAWAGWALVRRLV